MGVRNTPSARFPYAVDVFERHGRGQLATPHAFHQFWEQQAGLRPKPDVESQISAQPERSVSGTLPVTGS